MKITEKDVADFIYSQKAPEYRNSEEFKKFLNKEILSKKNYKADLIDICVPKRFSHAKFYYISNNWRNFLFERYGYKYALELKKYVSEKINELNKEIYHKTASNRNKIEKYTDPEYYSDYDYFEEVYTKHRENKNLNNPKKQEKARILQEKNEAFSNKDKYYYKLANYKYILQTVTSYLDKVYFESLENNNLDLDEE